METVLLFEVHHHLWAKVKKQLEDDHLLLVETLSLLDVGQHLGVKVKKQLVEATHKKYK